VSSGAGTREGDPGPAPLVVVRAGAPELAGEAAGPEAGAPIVLLHGLTATRRYVVHGSRLLPRQGHRAISYDARGHGESDPAPPDGGYGYDDLADDLDGVIEQTVGDRRCVLAGHSMGAHTIAAKALRDSDRVAAIVAIGPAVTGVPPSEETLAYWERLASGLEEGGVDGFVAAIDHGLDPAWRDVVLRFTRDRISRHRHPDALVRALRAVPRSLPFDGLAELEFLDLPALVVASHDDPDPGHPFAVGEAWAERLPQARLVSEEPGESPLAWQGAQLSREIDAFCREPAVAARLAA
jgi:pimeloyl-ACP methyl ester carboxylesterase